MQNFYEIHLDRDHRLLRLRLFGLWNLDTVERYAEDVEREIEAARAAGVPASSLRVLIDLREQGVQPRDVAERVQERFGANVLAGRRHAVLVSSSALQGYQAKRLGSSLTDVIFCSEESEALSWLRAPPCDR